MNAPVDVKEMIRRANENHRKMFAPPKKTVTVVRDEKYWNETINGLKHVIEAQKQELASMKTALREKEARLAEFTKVATKWDGGAQTYERPSMREICQKVLDEHYPRYSLEMLVNENRDKKRTPVRDHCAFEVFFQRPDLALKRQAAFFRRDRSSYRRAIMMHAGRIGVEVDFIPSPNQGAAA